MPVPATRTVDSTNENSPNRQAFSILIASTLTIAPLLLSPSLRRDAFRTNFLPHLYCYLSNPRLVWANVAADSLIGFSYFSISATIAYLVFKSRRNLPLHWLFLAFGMFIAACGGTHIMEVVTIWIPIYVLSTFFKTWTAIFSLVAAVLLPLQVSYILTSVEKARQSEAVTARLRASEERKEILLQEVHHRVKNNLALISSLFYLQSTYARDPRTIQVFRDMENRVYAIALVHESLYSSENLKEINFADFVRQLAENIVASYEIPRSPVRLQVDLEPVMMSVDTALPCGLILNELMSNAFKHGLPNDEGEIRLTLHNGPNGKCILSVQDSCTADVPSNVVTDNGKSLGLRLVRLLSRQISATFELVKGTSGNMARLQFTVDNHAN
jgi:two-component sensor histidine kinase